MICGVARVGEGYEGLGDVVDGEGGGEGVRKG